MNIEELLDYIKSNRSKIKGITDVDLIQIEAQIKGIKDQHPESDELEAFFNQNIALNNFNIISKLVQVQHVISDDFLKKITMQLIDKLEEAKPILTPPFGDFSKILFLKEADFYVFLNHIKTPEIEEKVKDVLKLLMAIYEQDSGSEMAGKSFIALNNFVAIDEELGQLINGNKFSSEVKASPFLSKKVKYNLIYLVVFIFVSFRVALFVKELKYFNNYNTNNDMPIEYKSEPRKIDRYYTDMKFRIDSFFVFLAAYNKDDIKQLTALDNLKTGENPFETFYQSTPQGESNNFIKVKNNTNFDMILLENATVFDTIKIPKAAYYIKAGKTLEVTKRETDANSVFNFYIGKKLASFQTNSNHIFVRNKSIIEYRFSELLPTTMTILRTDYSLINDTTVSLKNDTLKMN
jgi:hypothetical protein